MIIFALPAGDAKLGQAAGFLLYDNVPVKNLDILKKDVLPVRNNLLPVLFSGIIVRGFHQPEIPGPLICENIETVAAVTDVILMLWLPGMKNPESPLRTACVKQSEFGRERAVGAYCQEFFCPGFEDIR